MEVNKIYKIPGLGDYIIKIENSNIQVNKNLSDVVINHPGFLGT